MVSPRLLIATLAAVSLCATALAVEPPQPVSPGSTEIIERIATPCPTFSWAQVPGTVSLRLAVYVVPDNEDAPSVLRFEKELPGSTSSWTPSLPDCLTPGTYAWGVGALMPEGGPFWSKGSWFEVVAVGTALPGTGEEPGRPTRNVAVAAPSGAVVPEEGSGVRGRIDAVAPQPARLLYTYFAAGANGAVKAGAVDATSFTGDGSGLTNLTPTNIAAGTAGIDISGNAATATTISPLTPGGVLFGSATNTIGQDAAQFFWDNTNKRLGLGTGAPQQQLELTGNLRLPQTTNTPIGVIYLGPTKFMHAYDPANALLNTFLGFDAGNFTMGGVGVDGTYNTGVGYHVLRLLTTGRSNSALGNTALDRNTSGNSNTALGSSALSFNAVGSQNTAVGGSSLEWNKASSRNTAVGAEALINQSYDPGSAYYGNNTAVGYHALGGNNPTDASNGLENTAVGASSMYWNTIGSHNAALGVSSLEANTKADENVAVGASALKANKTASKNTAVGFAALTTQSFANGNAVWDSFNTALGYRALYANQPTGTSDGIDNTAVGALALEDNQSGLANTATGYRALGNNTTGNFDTAVGLSSLGSNTLGNENVAVGISALASNTNASYNTAVGAGALATQSFNTGGVAAWESLNTAVGYKALEQNEPTATNNGYRNTATGANALQGNVAGASNTAMGYMALSANTNGNNNTAVGASALGNAFGQNGNVALGYQAGLNEGGSNKLHIANAPAYDLIWGDFGVAAGQGLVVINAPVGVPPALAGVGLFVNGPVGSSTLPALVNPIPVCWNGAFGNCPSDGQLKTIVVPLSEEMDVLGTLAKLRGVAFSWDRSKEPMKNASERREIGMIAQEVEKVLPSLVAQGSDGYRSLDYAKLTALLVEVAKAQQAELTAQRSEIDELRLQVQALLAER